MVKISSYETSEVEQIQSAKRIAEKGRFYHYKRTYLLQVDKKTHAITLNLFERMVKAIVTLFGQDYFSRFFDERQVKVINPKTAPASKNNSHEQALRIISHTGFSTPIALNLEEAKTLVPKILRAANDDSIQEQFFYGKSHPGVAIIHSNQFRPILPLHKLIAVLRYMLLEGNIGFMAEARCGYYIGLDPKDTENSKSYQCFTNRRSMLAADQYIIENEVRIPANIPQHIKPLVREVIQVINENLCLRALGKKEALAVLDTYGARRMGFGLNFDRRAKEALDLLVANNIIHSYSQVSRNHKFVVRLKADDKIDDDPNIYTGWRSQSVIDEEIAFRENNRVDISGIITQYQGDNILLKNLVDGINKRVRSGAYQVRVGQNPSKIDEMGRACRFLQRKGKITEFKYDMGNFTIYAKQSDMA